MNANPIQPDSNELEELARLLPELVERELPSGRRHQLEEFVMSQIHQDPCQVGAAPRRTHKRRLAPAAAGLATVAVAAVAIGTGGFGLGRGADAVRPSTAGSVPPAVAHLSPVAQTFELAANYAAARPFTPPRPDQWIYIQDRELAPSSLAKSKGQNPDFIDQTWIRTDGKKKGRINNGRLEIWDQSSEYPTLSRLPTEPKALLTVLAAQLAANTRGPRATIHTPEEFNAALFRRIATILDNYLLPPAVTAALMRAAALVPGVTLAPGTVTVGGRQVTAVGRVQEGWRFEQLLLDPNTHEFVGYRSVASKDQILFPAGPSPIRVKKGEVQFTTTRLAAKIVDAAGQTN
jgi:hypothetical protein